MVSRLAHWILRRHTFAPCRVVDLLDLKFTGRCCTVCGKFDESSWELVGPRVANRSSLPAG